MKPRLRGVLHQYSFFVSLITGAALVLASSTPLARIGAGVYAVALSGLLGVSALYHRPTWPSRARRWMRRLDHSMIFLLIAGTYTPIALLGIAAPLGPALLAAVWVAASLGIVLKLAWIDAPRWLSVALYLLVGSLAFAAIPDLVRQEVWLPLALLASGGAIYVVGAVIYALRRPDPFPAVFGYHEIFHGCVVAAAGLHFGAVASYVVPF